MRLTLKHTTHGDGKTAIVAFGSYPNGRIAIRLLPVIREANETLLVATVNVPSLTLDENEVCVKDYSENAGVLQDLIEGGVVLAPTRRIALSDFVSADVCKLTFEAFSAYKAGGGRGKS